MTRNPSRSTAASIWSTHSSDQKYHPPGYHHFSEPTEGRERRDTKQPIQKHLVAHSFTSTYATKLPSLDPSPRSEQDLSTQSFLHLPQDNSGARSGSSFRHAPDRPGKARCPQHQLHHQAPLSWRSCSSPNSSHKHSLRFWGPDSSNHNGNTQLEENRFGNWTKWTFLRASWSSSAAERPLSEKEIKSYPAHLFNVESGKFSKWKRINMIIFQNWKRIAFSDDLSKVSGHLRQEEFHSPVQKNLTQIQLPNPHFAPIHRKHAHTHTAPWGNKDESSLLIHEDRAGELCIWADSLYIKYTLSMTLLGSLSHSFALWAFLTLLQEVHISAFL